MWHRVFGKNTSAVAPKALLERLQADPYYVSTDFHGDEEGWFRAEVKREIDPVLIVLERYLASEEDVRSELNTWAAWLEANAAQPELLMQHMVGTIQVFLIPPPAAGSASDHVELCKFLARESDGIIQIDGQGFFAADGTLLVRESDE